MGLDPFLIPQKQNKNQLKWIKDINVRPEAIKFIEENIGRIQI